MSTPAIKFRPSLTLDEISLLLSLLPTTPSQLRRKLEVFTLKAQHGITTPSHAAVGRTSLAASLGMAGDDTMDALLQLYQSSPSLLSPTQHARVQHHRYLNDLMTAEEEAAYELKEIS